MNASCHIMKIKELAKRYTPPSTQLTTTKACPKRLVAGQLWECRATVETGVPLRVMILEIIPKASDGIDALLVAPLLQDSCLAGPGDAILPREVMGHRLAVAADLAASCTRTALKLCLGRIPANWAQQIHTLTLYLEGNCDNPPHLERGLDYVDEQDLRLQHHQSIAKAMTILQESLLTALTHACHQFAAHNPPIASATVTAKERFAKWVHDCRGMMDALFPSEPEYALAAKGHSKGPLASMRLLAGRGRIRLTVSRCLDAPNRLAIEADKDPDLVLENAVLLDSTGKVLGRIRKGVANIPRPARNAFVIKLTSGRILKCSPMAKKR